MANGRELPYNAVGFPRVFYLRYHGYRLVFPAAGAGALSQSAARQYAQGGVWVLMRCGASPRPTPARGGGVGRCALGWLSGWRRRRGSRDRLDGGWRSVAGAPRVRWWRRRRLIDEGSDALVSFGLAGGLDPALRPGALIVPCAVIVDDVRYPADPGLSRMLGGVDAAYAWWVPMQLRWVLRISVASTVARLPRRLIWRAARLHVLPRRMACHSPCCARSAIRRNAPCRRRRWRHSTRAASSACGASSPPSPYGPGNFPRCSRWRLMRRRHGARWSSESGR